MDFFDPKTPDEVIWEPVPADVVNGLNLLEHSKKYTVEISTEDIIELRKYAMYMASAVRISMSHAVNIADGDRDKALNSGSKAFAYLKEAENCMSRVTTSLSRSIIANATDE